MKISLEKAKSQRQLKVYEQDCASTTLKAVTSKLNEYKAAANGADLSGNKDYQELVAYQMTYDERVDKAESEIKLLDQEIQSFEASQKEALQNELGSWSIK